MFVQLILQGIATGFVYALVAMGYILVFRSLNQVIYSQGHVFMVGSFLGYYISSRFGLSALQTLAVTLLFGIVFGFIIDRLVFRKLYNAATMSFVIAAIGVGIVLQNSVRILYPEPVKYAPIFGSRIFKILGAQIAEPYLWVIGIASLLLIILQLFFTKTKFGLAMRAVASDRTMAAAMGINVYVYISLTIILSMSIAVLGGVLIGPLYFASFDMGGIIGLKAFSAAILGGITSISGAAVGGLVLGICENLAAGYISSAYKDVVSLLILILMLLLRPNGILGKAKHQKV